MDSLCGDIIFTGEPPSFKPIDGTDRLPTGVGCSEKTFLFTKPLL